MLRNNFFMEEGAASEKAQKTLNDDMVVDEVSFNPSP